MNPYHKLSVGGNHASHYKGQLWYSSVLLCDLGQLQ